MSRIIFLALFFLPFPIAAQDLSYNYVQAIYFSSDVDVNGFDIDGDGIALDASAGVTDNLAVVFGYEDGSFDFDINTKALTLGVNVHVPVAPTTDFVVSVAYLDAEISDPFVSLDDTGNIISAGVRSRLNPNLEVGTAVTRVDVFDDSSTSFAVAALFGREVQFGVAFSTSDDSDDIGFGVRANF